ncbi:MAG: MotA/TolQ/ExbB proton channel family protein [Alphaproteobacteria bacterium]|nr:MotA/TolQ/ExbB proton channel family protein [Alphaproteobacteria bacterium]
MADATSPDNPNDLNIRIAGKRATVDFTTIFGIVFTFVLISIAIWIGKSDANFFNLPSFLIVVLGTISVTSVSFSWEEFSNAGKVIGNSLFVQRQKAQTMARQLMDIAIIGKKHGFLALAKLENELKKDKQLFKAVQIVTDGYNANDIERILSQDIDSLVERHRRSASILRRAADISPAMGLIGTLIGLVQMLANLQDPETIGPAMAVALLTTFYGAILGTAVLSPMAAKLERNSNDEAKIRTLILIAMTSIARQDNPRRLEMLLNSELPPNEQINYFD